MWGKVTTKLRSYCVPGSMSDIGIHSVYIICVIHLLGLCPSLNYACPVKACMGKVSLR